MTSILIDYVPRQWSMLPWERSAFFTFTIMLLKMGKLSLDPINTTDGHKTKNERVMILNNKIIRSKLLFFYINQQSKGNRKPRGHTEINDQPWIHKATSLIFTNHHKDIPEASEGCTLKSSIKIKSIENKSNKHCNTSNKYCMERHTSRWINSLTSSFANFLLDQMQENIPVS